MAVHSLQRAFISVWLAMMGLLFLAGLTMSGLLLADLLLNWPGINWGENPVRAALFALGFMGVWLLFTGGCCFEGWRRLRRQPVVARAVPVLKPQPLPYTAEGLLRFNQPSNAMQWVRWTTGFSLGALGCWWIYIGIAGLNGWDPQHEHPLGIAFLFVVGGGAVVLGYLAISWVGDLTVNVSQRIYQLRQGFWPLHRFAQGSLDDAAAIVVEEDTWQDGEGGTITVLAAFLLWNDTRRPRYQLCSRPDHQLDNFDAFTAKPANFAPILGAYAGELATLLGIPHRIATERPATLSDDRR